MAAIIQADKYSDGNLYNDVLKHSRWLKFVGVVLVCLGFATVILPMLPVLHSAAVLAGFLATSGMMYIAHAIEFWRYRWIGFFLHILAGIVYITAGNLVFIYPLANIQILAGILLISYLIMGVFRIMMALSQGLVKLGWSWTSLCGLMNIALAYFIWMQLSAINVGLLGLIVGVELLFTGCSLLRLGINARLLIN